MPAVGRPAIWDDAVAAHAMAAGVPSGSSQLEGVPKLGRLASESPPSASSSSDDVKASPPDPPPLRRGEQRKATNSSLNTPASKKVATSRLVWGWDNKTSAFQVQEVTGTPSAGTLSSSGSNVAAPASKEATSSSWLVRGWDKNKTSAIQLQEPSAAPALSLSKHRWKIRFREEVEAPADFGSYSLLVLIPVGVALILIALWLLHSSGDDGEASSASPLLSSGSSKGGEKPESGSEEPVRGYRRSGSIRAQKKNMPATDTILAQVGVSLQAYSWASRHGIAAGVLEVPCVSHQGVLFNQFNWCPENRDRKKNIPVLDPKNQTICRVQGDLVRPPHEMLFKSTGGRTGGGTIWAVLTGYRSVTHSSSANNSPMKSDDGREEAAKRTDIQTAGGRRPLPGGPHAEEQQEHQQPSRAKEGSLGQAAAANSNPPKLRRFGIFTAKKRLFAEVREVSDVKCIVSLPSGQRSLLVIGNFNAENFLAGKQTIRVWATGTSFPGAGSSGGSASSTGEKTGAAAEVVAQCECCMEKYGIEEHPGFYVNTKASDVDACLVMAALMGIYEVQTRPRGKFDDGDRGSSEDGGPNEILEGGGFAADDEQEETLTNCTEETLMSRGWEDPESQRGFPRSPTAKAADPRQLYPPPETTFA